MYQEHYVAFEATNVGERSRWLFIQSMPKDWRADFGESFIYEDREIIQYFYTPSLIDGLVATSLVRKLHGVLESSWNSAHRR